MEETQDRGRTSLPLRDSTGGAPAGGFKSRGAIVFRFRVAAAVLVAIAAFGFLLLRMPAPYSSECDLSYWPSSKLVSGEWTWARTPSGIDYNLYIPSGVDIEDPGAELPLIVVLHGSTGKAISKDRYGRLFTRADAQAAFGPKGAAVIAPQSRIEYYTDPDSYTRFIYNILIAYPCISRNRIALWGHSQGAAFSLELGAAHPGLFRAIAPGSSYYSASPAELFRLARLKVWYATARNDSGIWEQGHRTGRILAAICPDSRYLEYPTRGHFYIENADAYPPGDPGAEETFISWLVRALED